jgi:hypothetical protein
MKSKPQHWLPSFKKSRFKGQQDAQWLSRSRRLSHRAASPNLFKNVRTMPTTPPPPYLRRREDNYGEFLSTVPCSGHGSNVSMSQCLLSPMGMAAQDGPHTPLVAKYTKSSPAHLQSDAKQEDIVQEERNLWEQREER